MDKPGSSEFTRRGYGTVTLRQIELLLDFMEQPQHRSLAHGLRVRGKEGNVLSQRLWQSCANILNSEQGGAKKPYKGWKRYYHSFKCRVKTKLRAIQYGQDGTGGSDEAAALTPLEERLIRILGGANLLSMSSNSHDDSNNDPDNSGDGLEYVPVNVEHMESDDPDYNGDDDDETVDVPEKKPSVNLEPAKGKRVKRERRSDHCGRSPSPATATTDTKEMKRALDQLTVMEQTRIEIDRELVRANNRQAFALEEFVRQFTRLVDHLVQPGPSKDV